MSCVGTQVSPKGNSTFLNLESGLNRRIELNVDTATMQVDLMNLETSVVAQNAINGGAMRKSVFVWIWLETRELV